MTALSEPTKSPITWLTLEEFAKLQDVPEDFECKFCGGRTSIDPSDQTMPATTCDHPGEFEWE
jgi:hypothetical protein